MMTMQTLLKIAFSLATLTLTSFALSATSMKIEGSCTGNLESGEAVAFTYYSNFDGCKAKSEAAISFSQGQGNTLYTGNRSFTERWDIYRFQNKLRLTFRNQTGNLGGKLRYQDENGATHLIALQCEIRDYEYAECGN
jgi:hypothetical protein